MTLTRDNLHPNPMVQFERWFVQAQQHNAIDQANAMCIATIGEDGFPNSRFVLMKAHNDHSLVFYTNYESTKGRELLATPRIAVNFYWQPLKRQVRMQGTVEQVDTATADAYFASRARGSQLGAWASHQSKPLESREILEDQVTYYDAKYHNKAVPRPDYWSGFRIIPHRVEFWESQTSRLHDRFVYIKTQDTWNIQRLNP